MTCKHCCGADQLFGLKEANKKMRRFKRKGPDKVTRKLIQDLSHRNDYHDKTLLDIGGGIGALQWDFLEKGGSNTIHVDASNGFQQVAKHYANETGVGDRVRFIFGDFVDVSQEIDMVDFVTMDKVLCCYPNYTALLKEALIKCRDSIAISYPLGGFISKLITQFNRLYLYLKRNPFRTYVHSPNAIEEYIKAHGFEITKKSISFPWHIQVYKRVGG